MVKYVIYEYMGEPVQVPKEVADFLDADRRAMKARCRQDRRYRSRSSFETVLDSHSCAGRHDLELRALRNLSLESLRMAISGLEQEEQRLLHLRFTEELTLEEIGNRSGVSKMAISKRLKKLTQKLRDRVA